ncbi:dTDP-4-dehydrorhamnose 3,5-epimerase [Symmachiella dynata]|uniref:dTDP-4-dehydrorhamnose 3,5-epimerase n=1 Tax=Symmachiella dynata TaxID=2527995 RepID=A0A517ZVK2_9PLAN|nr:dTDP-4-dehydrorhamnose 3,5-epimerase [Symmachiella dynata]QDU46466.1 dTDP-4-dehydrorhamnose 3,5-epimerase [Symmachiella dynata]
MEFRETALSGMYLILPRVFEDPRGFFMETYHQAKFAAAGIPADFVQDNHSRSGRGTLRGLHYQIQHAQGKLVRCVRGEIYDVGVDLRRDSPTFGQSVGEILSEENKRQLYVPPGFAHGFCVVSEIAEVTYKCTDLYHPEYERSLLWNDPQLGLEWPIKDPTLSPKDEAGILLADAECYESSSDL